MPGQERPGRQPAAAPDHGGGGRKSGSKPRPGRNGGAAGRGIAGRRLTRRADSRRPAAFQASADRTGPSVGSPSRFPSRCSRPATGRGDPGTPSRDRKGTRERKSPRRAPVLPAVSRRGFASSGWRSGFAARSEGGRSATGRRHRPIVRGTRRSELRTEVPDPKGNKSRCPG